MTTIDRLRELGQSAWLDFLDHDLLVSGELDQMIARDGVLGMTSNPTIFQKAIASTSAYDEAIRGAASSASPEVVLEKIMTSEIRAACDRFLPVYEATEGRDGFVSIEVSPAAARDTVRSIEEARRLWKEVDRPNLFVKIPGTHEGVAAVRQCLVEGLNINITLLFSVDRYREIADAYLSALEARVARGAPIDNVASVASFFVSRVDAKVDRLLAALPNALAGTAGALRGQIAIANAKLAYDAYERLFGSERFRSLAVKGARPQRLLWASTTPKDKGYPDTYYVDALIGSDTVDTMTRETLHAYLDHGRPEARLPLDREAARNQMRTLESLAVDFSAVTRELEDEGVRAFAASFDGATGGITEKRRRLTAA